LGGRAGARTTQTKGKRRAPHSHSSFDRNVAGRCPSAATGGEEAARRRAEHVSRHRQQPAALEGYLGLNGALAKGALEPATRERIALAIAELNACDYCLSAHTYLGKKLSKLSDAEIAANRDGGSTETKADAAIRFAVKLAQSRGHASEDDIRAVKQAGYSDAQVIEIVLHVALNTLTNYVNETVKTEIDFPMVIAKAHEKAA
jgi:uncharacterized peroxidase-related enzyme